MYVLGQDSAAAPPSTSTVGPRIDCYPRWLGVGAEPTIRPGTAMILGGIALAAVTFLFLAPVFGLGLRDITRIFR